MLQYKLFKVHNADIDNTLSAINDIFGSEHIWIINKNIVGISYDYGTRDYKYVLKQVMKLNISQVIITSNYILSFLEEVINNNLLIIDLSFAKSITSEDKEFISKSIKSINLEPDLGKRRVLKISLFKELKWLTSDGCIDINYIDIEAKISNTEVYRKLQLYNNGVLLIDDERLKETIVSILNSIETRGDS